MFRWLTRVSVVALLILATAGIANAQQLNFGVPTPDVLGAGRLSVSTDQSVGTRHAANAATLQAIYGVGNHVNLGNMELGVGIGPLNERSISHSAAFVDLGLKWELPYHLNVGTGNAATRFNLALGNTVGFGFTDNVSGRVHDMAYASVVMRNTFTGMTVSAGPYYVTSHVFDTHDRVGAQVTFNQPLPVVPGLGFATVWQSGHNASLTPGFTLTKGNFTAGLGYGLSNNGRHDDHVVVQGTLNF